MPHFVETALQQTDLLAAYERRPPYQRNDYLLWINAAKREATKEKRLRQMLAELKAGNIYMRKAWTPRSDAYVEAMKKGQAFIGRYRGTMARLAR